MRGLRLRLGDEFGVRHRREHGLGALLGAFRIAVRRQPRRRLDEAGQHRGLGQRDVLRGLAEISLRGRFDAIGAGAEIDPVEIEFENFGLGMLALQPEREFDLLQLALQRALLRQEQVLGELLGQRRAALRNAAMQHVGHRRAQDAQRVDAVMRIEAAILDGDERLRQIGRQILQRDIGAGHFAARRQHAAVESDDLDGRRPFRNFERLDRAADARRPRSRRRSARSPPTGRAPRPNRTAEDSAARAASGFALSARRGCARLPLGRGVLVRFAQPCVWRLVSPAARRRRRRRDPSGRGAIRKAKRRARISAPCVRRSFSVPTPCATPLTPVLHKLTSAV